MPEQSLHRTIFAPRDDARERRTSWSKNSWTTRCAALLTLTVAIGCSEDTERITNVTVESDASLGAGLEMTIHSVEISSNPGVVVEFSLASDEGPLSLSDLDSNPRFVLAYIDVDPVSGLSRYQAYTVADVAGEEFVFEGEVRQPALEEAPQVVSDSGGVFEELGDGNLRYTFGTELPNDFDRSATHTLAAWVSRQNRQLVSNPVFSFVPGGGPVTLTREIAPTAACNSCHDPLAIHGGTRRAMGLCVVCHTDQTVDPETGENLELSQLVHKIHRGGQLAVKPYFVVGFRQSVHDYSDLGYPQDSRNCTTCHQEDGADADHWRLHPSRAACGSCHDEIDFETGENHLGIQQFDDIFCTNCHRGEQVVEFDNSVPGAHVVPYFSSANPDLTLAITDVMNMTPGNQPSVRFTITDVSGPVDIASLSSISMLFAGPTTDYSQIIGDHRFSISGTGLMENAVGDYTFAPDGYLLPIDANGTWSIGMEARTNAIAVGAPGDTEDIRFGANNPVVHIDVADGTLGGGSPLARRAIVDEAACQRCHENILEHGNLRTDLEYCLLCHNLWATDESRRPGVDAISNPPESVDFKLMIHRIHTGEELENPYVVFGFGGTEHSYNDVRYPGDRRNCEACHTASTESLPLPATTGPTVVHIGGVPLDLPTAIRTPATSACTGCHDGEAAFTHARLNSIVVDETDASESCSVCHGSGRSEAVDDVHAR